MYQYLTCPHSLNQRERRQGGRKVRGKRFSPAVHSPGAFASARRSVERDADAPEVPWRLGRRHTHHRAMLHALHQHIRLRQRVKKYSIFHIRFSNCDGGQIVYRYPEQKKKKKTKKPQQDLCFAKESCDGGRLLLRQLLEKDQGDQVAVACFEWLGGARCVFFLAFISGSSSPPFPP